ncbi:MAG: cupredoxin domain-containing protein [Chloroflexota bacterium]
MMFSRLVPALMALALLVAACTTPTADAPAGSQVVAELADSKITVNVPSVKAGKIKIGVRNLGTMEHSFVVLKTDLAPDKLPVDGPSAKAKEDGKIGDIPSIPAGKSAAVTLDLTPGKYVFICNIAGHYQLGMHTGFTVEAP